MNCKPGDLAVILGESKVAPGSMGRFCTVLYAAPMGEFRFPDGVLSDARNSSQPFWVIEFQNPLIIGRTDGTKKPAKYACCPDSRLRPIRDNDGDDETLQWAIVPGQKVAA